MRQSGLIDLCFNVGYHALLNRTIYTVRQKGLCMPLTMRCFANQALAKLSEVTNLPVIASGGAGKISHFTEAFTKGNADAALAASVFHFGEIEIPILKTKLKQQQIAVRIDHL